MRKLFYPLAILLLIVPLLAACGGDDDDDDATTESGGTVTSASTPAGTPTTNAGAAGTGTTTEEGTPAGTMTDTTATTGGDTTATAEEDGTATEEGTEEATGEATGEATEDATGEATEDATGTADDGTTTPGSGTATAGAGDATPEEEALLELLLTEDEALEILGEDWTETSRGPVEDDEMDSVGICGASEFPRRDEKIAHVEVNWEGADGTAGAFENIVEFPEDVVAEAMEYVRTSVDCTEWTDDDGDTATVTPWDNSDLEALGDDVVGIIVGVEISGVPVDLYVAFVQTNELITQVMYGNATADAATAEQTALDLLTAAIEKVGGES